MICKVVPERGEFWGSHIQGSKCALVQYLCKPLQCRTHWPATSARDPAAQHPTGSSCRRSRRARWTPAHPSPPRSRRPSSSGGCRPRRGAPPRRRRGAPGAAAPRRPTSLCVSPHPSTPALCLTSRHAAGVGPLLALPVDRPPIEPRSFAQVGPGEAAALSRISPRLPLLRCMACPH